MTAEPRPVISGFYPDPSVARVGNDFYVVTSSFEYFPGVPIFHSTNLADWTPIGHVLDRPSQLDVAAATPSGGVFAPTLRHHAGRFWMITTNVTDGGGQILVSATDPAGPWSEPVRIPGIAGIDPDLAWDEEGRALVSFAAFNAEHTGSVIRQVEIDTETGALVGTPVDLWQGTGHKFPEGPHLYNIGEFWYLLLAEGGTERGHSVVVSRGPSPQGPFVASPHGPLLTRRGHSGVLQNTGHGDLVQRPDGGWALVFLGVRIRGASPDFHVLGRETFAADVRWTDGWPLLAGLITPTAPVGAVRDGEGPYNGQFEAGSSVWSAGTDWAASGRHAASPVTFVRNGELTLNATAESDVFLGRRQEHLAAEAGVIIRPANGSGALVLRLDPSHEYLVEVSADRIRAISQVGTVRATVGDSPHSGGTATVYLTAMPGNDLSGAPDIVTLGYVDDGRRVELARLDGRYLSTEVAGGFTGRFVGFVATEGHPAFSKFFYRGSDQPDAL